MEYLKIRDFVLMDIKEERLRQENLFGPEQNVMRSYPELRQWLQAKYVVLGEEVGEVARGIQDQDWQNVYDELVQVAAVSTALCEGLRINMELTSKNK